jgi:transcriptional regulator with XRE-family HTH domain
MSFNDFSARFKQAKGQEAPKEDKPYDHAEAYRLRGRILGLLIRDARIGAARTMEDCARLLQVSIEMVEAWELGDAVPSLPQLELLAHYLDIPVSHFWNENLKDTDPTTKLHSQNEYMVLRNRMIGALFHQAREDANLTLEQISEMSGVSVQHLQAYELGDLPIPMNELYVLHSIVKKPMEYFIETSGYIGELLQIREEWKKFTSLDEDVRRFAANPSNYMFIKVAMLFSQMSSEQLRKAGAGILDISM